MVTTYFTFTNQLLNTTKDETISTSPIPGQQTILPL